MRRVLYISHIKAQANKYFTNMLFSQKSDHFGSHTMLSYNIESSTYIYASEHKIDAPITDLETYFLIRQRYKLPTSSSNVAPF